MRDIAANVVIQIEVTDACPLACQEFTLHVGHHPKPFFMELDFAERAIRATLDSPSRLGLMGGEPTLHKDFRELLALWRDLVPLERRELWTAGFRWGEYADDIKQTFLPELIHYNDHVAYDGMHKPLLIALNEVIDDPELKKQLLDNCPYQTHWSASITPKGGFFCEVAASLDWLFDGPGGWPVVEGWWKRTVADYTDQVERYCGNCSGAIPMEAFSDGRGGRDGPTIDHVTPGILAKLAAVGSPKVQRGNFKVFDRKITREDIEKHAHKNPREYRTFIAHSPQDVKNHLTTESL